MANLFTKHDPGTIHKSLGLLGMLHYLHTAAVAVAPGTRAAVAPRLRGLWATGYTPWSSPLPS